MNHEERTKVEDLLVDLVDNCESKEERLNVLAEVIVAVEDTCFDYFEDGTDIFDVLKVWKANQDKAYSSIVQQLGGI